MGGLGLALGSGDSELSVPSAQQQALMACLTANEALLHRAALQRPLSVLK